MKKKELARRRRIVQDRDRSITLKQAFWRNLSRFAKRVGVRVYTPFITIGGTVGDYPLPGHVKVTGYIPDNLDPRYSWTISHSIQDGSPIVVGVLKT